MRSLKVFPLALLVLLLASCTLSSGGSRTPTSVPPLPPQAPRPAQDALAAELNVPVDSIEVLDVQSASFVQACFEFVAQQLNCVEGDIVGYNIALRYQDQVYEYRQSADGQYIKQIGQVSVAQYVGEQARYDLAGRLNADPGQIDVTGITTVTFSNDCLDLPSSTACAATQTPGFIISLSYNGQNYEYRANSHGGALTPSQSK